MPRYHQSKSKQWRSNEEVQVIEEQQKLDSNSSPMNIPTVARQQKISKIDLSGLTSKQRDMVRNIESNNRLYKWNRFSDRERWWWCGRKYKLSNENQLERQQRSAT